MLAARHDHVGVVKLLIAAGADMLMTNKVSLKYIL
jgi:hypothetical protein